MSAGESRVGTGRVRSSLVRCEVGMIEAPKVVVPFEEAILVGFLKDCVWYCRYICIVEMEAPEENEQCSDQLLD